MCYSDKLTMLLYPLNCRPRNHGGMQTMQHEIQHTQMPSGEGNNIFTSVYRVCEEIEVAFHNKNINIK